MDPFDKEFGLQIKTPNSEEKKLGFDSLSIWKQSPDTDDFTQIMKRVGLEAGPISPTATDESSLMDETWDITGMDQTVEAETDVVEQNQTTPNSMTGPHPQDRQAVSGLVPPADPAATSTLVEVETAIGEPTIDFQELRRRQQIEALKDVQDEEDVDPFKMLRRGAVAAVGGTMVGLGIVLIPMPIPLGVAVTSSGLAVLGTEFESAKEMNEKIATTTRTHWKTAREHIIRGIEQMEGRGRPTEIDTSVEMDQTNHSTGEDANESPSSESGGPRMNPLEQQRQEAIASQAKMPNFFDEWRRNTGSYLSKHLVPMLRSPRADSGGSSVPDGEVTVRSEGDTISEGDIVDDLNNDGKKTETPIRQADIAPTSDLTR